MLDPTLSMPPRGASNDPALRETTGRGNAGYVNTGTSAWEEKEDSRGGDQLTRSAFMPFF